MSTRLVRFILVVTLGCAAAVRAEDAPKPPPYVLKNKSVFTAVADEQRAPFWPIGWVKRRAMQVATAPIAHAVEAPKPVYDEKCFKVTSILLGNPSLAIINGRTYSEGEFLRMPKPAATPGVPAAPTVRIRVFRVEDGRVVLQYQEQFITVALQRPELAQRKAEELLSDDRP